MPSDKNSKNFMSKSIHKSIITVLAIICFSLGCLYVFYEYHKFNSSFLKAKDEYVSSQRNIIESIIDDLGNTISEKFPNLQDKDRSELANLIISHFDKNLFLLDAKNRVLIASNKIKTENQKIANLSSVLQGIYNKAIEIGQTGIKNGFYIYENDSHFDSNSVVVVKNIGSNFILGVSTNLHEFSNELNMQKNSLKSDFLYRSFIALFCLVVVLTIITLIASHVREKVGKMFMDMHESIDAADNNQSYISQDKFEFEEFKILAGQVNMLVEKTIYEKNKNKNIIFKLEQYTQALGGIAMVFKFDKNETIIFANTNACKTLRYARDEMLGMKCKGLCADDVDISSLMKQSWQGNLKLNKKDGEICHIKASILSLSDSDGETEETLMICYDITEYVAQSERLKRHLSDPLTKLKNRQALIDKLEDSEKYSFVANLDILRFKQINEYYGFKMGDVVLLEVSNRLLQLIDDKGLELFKLTNDNFAIIGLKKQWDAKKFATFCGVILDDFLKNPIVVDDNKFDIRLVFGISSDVGRFITSEIAKDYAKTNKQSVVIFDKEKDTLIRTINLTQSVKKAIEEDRIVLYKQAIVNNDGRKDAKYECLLRMVDEKGALVPPLDFLYVAKRSNLYQELTKVVIKKSFEYFGKHDLKSEFSINLAIDDIVSSDIVEFLRINLEKYDGIGRRLTLEILEDEGINNFAKVNEFIAQMREFGCKIAIDDFGTGYSNFEYLLRIKADFIKIDGSMIKNIDKDSESRRIVELMVEFTKRLGIKTVAEFVHSNDVSQTVKAIGIDASQGYYHEMPKPLDS